LFVEFHGLFFLILKFFSLFDHQWSKCFYGGECGDDGEPLLIYQHKLAGADHHSIRHHQWISNGTATEKSAHKPNDQKKQHK
jgi:hypothetical protein